VKRHLRPLLCLGGGLLILFGGVVLYQGSIRRAPVILNKTNAVTKPDTIKAFHARGQENAAVTIEEFGDFECEPCRALAGILDQLSKESDAPVRLVFHHFPLVMHSHAAAAAAAAEAAGLQGRFWEMHDVLYREQPVWSSAADPQLVFDDFATSLGLDVARFQEDCQADQIKQLVQADKQAAIQRGVNQTPTLFMNSWAVPRGSYSVGGLRTRVNMMLASLPHDVRK